MGMKESGCAALAVLLRQGGARAIRRAREQMKREGQKIEQLAKDNAPIDEGDLEAAIRMRKTYEDNRRLAVEIAVEAVGNVGDYALEMHEGLQPYGDGGRLDYHLGPRSQAKAATGKAVGGKYLERAFEEREDKMLDAILAEVRKEIG